MIARYRKKGVIAALLLALGVALPVQASMFTPSAFETKIEEAKTAMMADSAKALELSKEAAELARGDDQDAVEARLTANWLEGEALMRLNRTEEGEELVERTLAKAERVAAGTKLHADLLRTSGSIKAYSGDYGSALAILTRAHERYKALGEARSEAIVLQNIGSLYSDARDYERVLRYYREARAAYPEDPALSLSSHNNVGNALKELGNYEEAEAEFAQALDFAETMESPLLVARILTNIASTQFLAGELDKAERSIVRGLSVRDEAAGEWAPFLYGVRAQVALARGNVRLAERYLALTFAGQDLSETSPFFRDFHETAFTVYSRLDAHEIANSHLLAFNRLDSQARDLSATANNALLGARFDAANRELRISRLSAEKAVNEARLSRTENKVVLLTAGIGLVVIAFVTALLALRAVARSKRAISEANAKLTYVTQHDGLTGLLARDHFRSLLEQAQRDAVAAKEQGVLMLVDLDRFKQVNDNYGHAAGDRMLEVVARRFRLAAGDRAVIGRLGGDEFGMFLPHPTNLDAAQELARSVIDAVSEPTEIHDFEMAVGASIGMAPFGAKKIDDSALMTNADLALYEAKDRGRGTFVVYQDIMRRDLEERTLLENDLGRALEQGQLSISYQPIVNVEKDRIVCYEALVRWNHPERGVVLPSVFIPIAEESMLIEQLGAWVLRSACAEAAKWDEDVMLTVNISSLQLSNHGFVATVAEALALSGLSADRLLLELTESVVLEMDEQLSALLKSLNALGVRFALDDFGRGYSSLNYIEKMNFAMIKIDRDFVQSAASGSDRSEAIVSAIVSLADSLGIDVTAEGIESEEQILAMAKLGCTCFQGYHFGKPFLMKEGEAIAEATQAAALPQPQDKSRKVA